MSDGNITTEVFGYHVITAKDLVYPYWITGVFKDGELVCEHDTSYSFSCEDAIAAHDDQVQDVVNGFGYIY